MNEMFAALALVVAKQEIEINRLRAEVARLNAEQNDPTTRGEAA